MSKSHSTVTITPGEDCVLTKKLSELRFGQTFRYPGSAIDVVYMRINNSSQRPDAIHVVNLKSGDTYYNEPSSKVVCVDCQLTYSPAC